MMQMTVLAMMFIPKRKRSKDNKKKYEMKRIRKFQTAWQEEFDWVVYQEETKKMYCSTCRKYAELADKSSPMYIGCGDGVQGFRRETLTAHSKSRCHVVCLWSSVSFNSTS